MKKFSWLKLVNMVFLQWLFIRLTKCSENRIVHLKVNSFDLMSDGNFSLRGQGDTKTYQWFAIQYWILPLSGWGNKFKFIGKEAKFIRITKETELTK